ncbi:hypothetical protein Metbo_0417 [Methanobacterium lacus]|uniref:Uncharacterized protein n=1 Tax=Methanobacterium lacus (strain AL-21) TaxID=877455 RepID=F0T947_METLA|nr:hypothetical protein [Methanobacterium lacus]ADZ08669.1 hypothetical protein Metbo_0417 [Methanobacterium lacus]
MDQTDYKIISNSNRCQKCYFRFEVVLDDIEEINISCRHPMGPGNSMHCIYFKNMDMD